MIVISNIPIVGTTRGSGAKIGSVSTYDQRHHFEYCDSPTQLEFTRANSAICKIPNAHRTATNKIDPDSYQSLNQREQILQAVRGRYENDRCERPRRQPLLEGEILICRYKNVALIRQKIEQWPVISPSPTVCPNRRCTGHEDVA
jgi:hypothetical protein